MALFFSQLMNGIGQGVIYASLALALVLIYKVTGILNFAQGAEIKPSAGDPHDALVHGIVAFNRDAPEIRQAANMLQGVMQGATSPLAWIGSSIAVYADDDPFWKELAQQPDDTKRLEFVEKNLGRLPVAVHFEVASPLRLTAAMAASAGAPQR